MSCESWKATLDTYLDGELPADEMGAFDAHVRSCPACAADALTRLQMKRAIQAAGKRFDADPDFRKRVLESIAPKPRRSFRMRWIFAVATVVIVGALFSIYVASHSAVTQSSRNHLYSEIADLHVATLASSTPVDVISTDRHTVKPWFQGKIPFAFNLPELQNTGFSLLGGRVTYLDQTPGAHLIYDVGKHHISVFIFQERWLAATLPASQSGNSLLPEGLPFHMDTWSQGGLRYFVIGDASVADIDRLSKLLKADK